MTEVPANRPLRLGSPSEFHRVVEGTLDLFLAEEGRPPVHVLRAGPGDLVGGVEDGWLARGTPGTRVEPLSLAEALEDSGRLDRWISALAAAVAPDLPPRRVAILEGHPLEIPPDGAVLGATGRPPAWVAGDLLVLGQEPLEGRFFPLVGGLWLTGSGRVEPRGTRDLPDLAEHLAGFHRWALRRLLALAAREDTRFRERLEKLAVVEQVRLTGALLTLGAVLSPQAGQAASAYRPAFLEACRAVAAAAGIRLRVEHEERYDQGEPPVRMLERLARESGFRFRQVQLTGRWWEDDCGPLLGLRKDGTPVALVRERGAYRVPPDLTDVAYTFYRGFPARRLNFMEVVGFCLAGSATDQRRLATAVVVGALLSMVVPIGTAILFSDIIPEARRSELLELTLGLGVGALSATVFQLVRGFAVLRLQGKVDAALEAAVWDRLLDLPVPFFRRYTAGELADRAVGLSVVREVLGGSIITAVLGALVAMGNLVVLLFLAPALAAGALFLAAVPVVFMVWVGRRLYRIFRKLFAVQGEISGLVLQFLTGISKLRAAGAERRAFALWAHRFARQRELNFRARAELNRVVAWNAAWPALGTALLFTMVALHRADLPMGRFLAFYAAFGGLLSALLSLGPAAMAALAMAPRFERAAPILEAVPEGAGGADPGELTGSFELSRVSFRYSPESPLVLQDVSFRVEPGEFVAVVGPSGSGKSTLVRLLLGFETPESGAVYYDGVDLSNLDVRLVRRQVGVVLQNSQLMAGTLLTNLVGTSAATQEDAWAAVRLAGLEEDVLNMPMGLQTRVDETAETFSGGQKQRLLIARALVSRPRLVLFDEATSALDNPAQEVVTESLQRLRATRLVIAHRLSTIRQADRILVMKDGRVVQEGTFEALVAEPGTFRDLALRQMVQTS